MKKNIINIYGKQSLLPKLNNYEKIILYFNRRNAQKKKSKKMYHTIPNFIIQFFNVVIKVTYQILSSCKALKNVKITWFKS
jgi:uncharacterized membrane protein YadS